MALYKFLDQEWIQPTLSGQFAFGRLRYYQLLELVTGSLWIGDRYDGVTEFKVDHVHIQGDSPARRQLERTGAFTFHGKGGSLELTDFTAIMEVDGFVLSLAHGAYQDLAPVYAAERGAQPGYESCIEIADPDAFRAAMNDAVVVGSQFDGIALRDVLATPPIFGRVSYGSPTHELLSANTVAADAFTKRTNFSEQSEYRVLLVPRQEINLDRIIVRLPQGRMLREIVSGPPKITSPTWANDASDAEATLEAAFKTFEGLAPSTERWMRFEQSLAEYNKEYEVALGAFVEQHGSAFYRGLISAYWALRKNPGDSAVDQMFRRNPMPSGANFGGIIRELKRFLTERMASDHILNQTAGGAQIGEGTMGGVDEVTAFTRAAHTGEAESKPASCSIENITLMNGGVDLHLHLGLTIENVGQSPLREVEGFIRAELIFMDGSEKLETWIELPNAPVGGSSSYTLKASSDLNVVKQNARLGEGWENLLAVRIFCVVVAVDASDMDIEHYAMGGASGRDLAVETPFILRQINQQSDPMHFGGVRDLRLVGTKYQARLNRRS